MILLSKNADFSQKMADSVETAVANLRELQARKIRELERGRFVACWAKLASFWYPFRRFWRILKGFWGENGFLGRN
jgi:hypothetical protein